ncbi:MAG: 30S ribosome-binding factor RbfA [Chloroflexia bacterium]
MPSRRTVQVASLILQELSLLLQRETKDPGIGFVTLTDVEVSPDLRAARVYFSVLGDEQAVRESQQALERASGFLRHELAQRLTLRFVPELHFVRDRSIERGQRIRELLREIEEERKPSGEG